MGCPPPHFIWGSFPCSLHIALSWFGMGHVGKGLPGFPQASSRNLLGWEPRWGRQG